MSHYSVLVVGEDVEEAMKPFDENNELEHVFVDDEDEYREKYETGDVEMVRLKSGKLVYTWDEMFKVGTSILDRETVIPEDLERVTVLHRERYPTFEDFVRDWCGDQERDAVHDRYGHYKNPQGKWDWYQIGGRWNGTLALKPGATSGRLGDKAFMHPSGMIGAAPLPIEPGWVDSALKGDVDFDAMNERSKKRSAEDFRSWHETPAEERSKWWVDKDWPPLDGETVEGFVNRHFTPWATYAFLDAKGQWHERQTWTGKEWVENENWLATFADLLAQVGDGERITVVDSHS